MPDPVYGERVCVFVVPESVDATLTLGALMAFLEGEGLGKCKWPERLELITEFPVTTSGKRSKVLLRQQLIDQVFLRNVRRDIAIKMSLIVLIAVHATSLA